MSKDVIKEYASKMRSGEFTLRDYVELVYPPPEKGEEGYSFYKQWGYERWIIRDQKQNVDSIKEFLKPQYNQLMMLDVVELSDKTRIKESSLRGLPIVIANRNIQQYFNNNVAKGWIGIQLWEDSTGKFCLFRGTKDLVAKYFDEGEVDMVGEDFENYEQFSRFASNEYFPSLSATVGKKVEIDGRIGEVKGHQAGFKPYDRFSGMLIVEWENTGKEQEVMVNLDDIRRVENG